MDRGSADWNAHWRERGQPWRTEPEIDTGRQAELERRRAIMADVIEGSFPFKDLRLSRGDIEWLLATHEDGRGPVDPTDPAQGDRVGLDLRGADLSYLGLSNLPLARTGGNGPRTAYSDLTQEQRRRGAINLHGATLSEAHLEESLLDYSDMGHVNLTGAHLEGSNLWAVNLSEANCDGAHFEGADLWNAHLEGAFLYRSFFQRARLHEAYLAGAHINQLHLTDEDGVGPFVADMHWEGVNLSVVNWSQIGLLGDDTWALQPDLHGVQNDPAMRKQSFKSAIRANQQVALALQAQGMTDEANRFSYRSRVLHRKALALYGQRRLAQYLLSLLLDALTGYGYRMSRMVAAYVVLILVFAAFYYGFSQGDGGHLGLSGAAVQSITAFHGRVFSAGIKPNSPQSVVTAVEAITGFLFEGVFIAMLAQRVFGR